MENEQGWPASVNGEHYLRMLREMRIRADRRGHWWMQDGAMAQHSFFGGKVLRLSHRSKVDWPPYSPDLTPLDYFFWSLAMIQVCCQKTSTIAELTAIVEDVAATAPKEMMHDAVGNIRKHCQACQMAEGSQYEPFLKKI